MDRISELLDQHKLAYGGSHHKQTRLEQWMTEVTNRIQELEYKVEAQGKALRTPEDAL